MEIYLIFIIMLLGITLSVPIGMAIALATCVSFALFTNITPMQIAQYMTIGLDSFPMMAIPFFILAGIIMSKGGVARRLVDLFMSFIGHIKGGLGVVMTVTCCFFGAISGSATATTSSIGGVMIPEMKKYGYPAGFCSALAATAGIIGIIIPPSIAFVIYGCITNTSVSELFLAGIVPGILITIILSILCIIIAIKEDIPTIPRKTWKERWHSLWEAKWSVFAPVIILGGIYSGIFTPTESAVVAIIYSLIIGMFVYKEINLHDVKDALLETILISGSFTFLLAVATAFARYITFEQVPGKVVNIIIGFTTNKIMIMLLVNIFLLIVGCVMDNIPALTILAPILLPVAVTCGYTPVQFGVIIVLNTCIGLITPPYGPDLYLANMIAKCKFGDSLKYLWPLLAGMIISLLIVTYLPGLSTLLL